MTARDFDSWIATAYANEQLTQERYDMLTKPSTNTVSYFRAQDQTVYDNVIMKYMHSTAPNEVKALENKAPSRAGNGMKLGTTWRACTNEL
ncbi:COX aromatic rich motif-containing protein [Candidatus Saccharibacteria bacterium]|nr:MAG: COX aromatic rich motif-containing protein [Candidatus Saccharibacteria bacterium]